MTPLVAYFIGLVCGFLAAIVLRARVSRLTVTHLAPPDSEKITPEESEQIFRLVESANASANRRGHILGEWRELSSDTYASCCTVCQLEVVIKTKPQPNEIDIAGPAVALMCETHHERE